MHGEILTKMIELKIPVGGATGVRYFRRAADGSFAGNLPTSLPAAEVRFEDNVEAVRIPYIEVVARYMFADRDG